MFCNNCGAELKDGTLICERCGARQSAGGNGGNGNKGGGGKKPFSGFGGYNFGKILAAVLGVCVIIGGIFGITRSQLKNEVDGFTHNIEFENNNLSVTNNGDLRFREVPNNQTFSVSSMKEYVDINLINESGTKVDFSLSKNKNNYIISPKPVWDSSHAYYLSLGGDTFFTDEDLYQFKSIVYTIKKEDVATYTFNKNIIDITETNGDVDIKDDDVVVYLDSDEKKQIGKVKLNENGIISYEEPMLADIFEELQLNGNFEPNYDEIEWNTSGKGKFLYNIKQSKFLQNIIQTVYADNNEFDLVEGITQKGTGATGLSMTGIPVDDICSIDIKSEVETEYGKYFEEVDSKSRSKSLKITIDIELSPYNGKMFHKEVPDNVSLHIILTKKFAVLAQADIDFSIWHIDETVFDVQFLEYQEDDFTFDLKWSVSDDPDHSIEFSDDFVSEKIEINNEQFLNGKKALVRDIINFSGNDNLITEPIYTIIKKIPIPTTIPFVSFYAELNLNGNFEGEINAGISINRVNKNRYGIDNRNNQSLQYTKINMNSGRVEGHINADVKSKVGISPSLGFRIGGEIPLIGVEIYPVDISIADELGVYMYAYGEGVIGVNGEISHNLGVTSNVKISDNTEIGADAKAGISLKIGPYGSVFLDGKINIISPLLEEKVIFFNEDFDPFIEINEGIKVEAKIDDNLDINVFNVGNVGSVTSFGPYNFKVLDKKENEGIALLASVEGVEAKPYNKVDGNNNINIAYTWGDSSLRNYLNNEFIKKFSDDEKNAMYKYKHENPGNSKYGINGGKDTEDNIYILSKDELEKYYHSDSERQLKASADAHGAYVCNEDNVQNHRVSGNTVYWVRNPGNMTISAMAVNSDGSINEEGASISREDVCVRPVMWIRYKKIDRQVSLSLEKVKYGVINKIDGE